MQAELESMYDVLRITVTATVLLVVALPARAADPPANPAATQPATRSAVKDRTFTNKKHKVRFRVPGTMEYLKSDVPGLIALYRAKPSHEGGGEPPLELVQMLVIEAKPDESAKVIVQSMQEKIEKSGGKVARTEPATLGGEAAHEIDWAGVMQDKEVEAKQVVCVRDGKAYVLNFIAKPGQLVDFMKRAHVALDSFEWLE